MINIVVKFEGINVLQLSKGSKATIADLKREVLRRLDAYGRLSGDNEYRLTLGNDRYLDEASPLGKVTHQDNVLVVELIQC